METLLTTFKSSKVAFNQLVAGIYSMLTLVRVVITDSHSNFDGTEKETLPEWKDKTPQLAVTVTHPDPKMGGCTHRLNLMGYVRFDDLSKEKRESGKWADVKGYAVNIADGKRREDDERTAQCESILNQFFNSVSTKNEEGNLEVLPEGSTIEDLQNVAGEAYLGATVTESIFGEGETATKQFRLEKFRKPQEVPAGEAGEDQFE